jgi:hypothetical protein
MPILSLVLSHFSWVREDLAVLFPKRAPMIIPPFTPPKPVASPAQPLPNISAAPAPAPEVIPPAQEITMTDTLEADVTNIATSAAATGVQAVEAVAGSVISKIASGAMTVWTDIENDIEADYAKVKAALPASAQATLATTVTDVKQGASDAISYLDSAASTVLPALAKTGEAALDQALATNSNGVALPLVPLVNGGIDDIVSMLVSTAQAWGLKAKASLAST